MKIYPIALVLLCVANTGFASSFDVDYSISLGNFYGYTDYSSKTPSSYKHNNFNSSLNAYTNLSYNINSNYTASITAYTMIDTSKEIENYNQGYWGEEVFFNFQTPIGDFSAGQDYNVAYNFAVGAPNIGSYRINNTDLTNFLINPNWYQKGSKSYYKTLNSTYINTDGASNKINYTTKEFFNTKLGLSYIPKVNSRSGLVSKDASYHNNEAYVLGLYNSFYLKDYEIETSLGFADYKENDKEYSLGFSVYRKGWTLGSSFRKTNTNKADSPLNNTVLYDTYREGYAYNAGISYEFGPLTTGVSYFYSKSDQTKNEDEIISFSNSYVYNKHTTISLTLAHQTSRDENITRGFATILGLEFML